MKKRRTHGKNLTREGSVTVEATLVLGLVLLLLTTVFYMAFYLHDRAVLKETAAYYAEAMLHMAEEPVDLEGRLESWRIEDQNIFRTNGYAEYKDNGAVAIAFQTTANERMLITKVTIARAYFNQRKIVLMYSVKTNMRQGSFAALVTSMEKEWSDEVRMELKMDPEEFVRLCRGVIWRKKQ